MTNAWRLREVFRNTGLTVHVIEAADTWSRRSQRYFQIHARLDTVAVVVTTASGIHAWDVNGEIFDIRRARDRMPDLDAVLQSVR